MSFLRVRYVARRMAPAAFAVLMSAGCAEPPAGQAAPGLERPLTVRLQKLSKLPAPDKAPYRDCLFIVRASVLAQAAPAGEQRRWPAAVVLAFVGFRDRKLEPAAKLAAGEELELVATPFEQTAKSIQSMQRADEIEDYDSPLLFVSSWRRRPASK
jgi:hypothetical protein